MCLRRAMGKVGVRGNPPVLQQHNPNPDVDPNPRNYHPDPAMLAAIIRVLLRRLNVNRVLGRTQGQHRVRTQVRPDTPLAGLS